MVMDIGRLLQIRLRLYDAPDAAFRPVFPIDELEIADQRLGKGVAVGPDAYPAAQRVGLRRQAEPRFLQPGDEFVHQQRVAPAAEELDADLRQHAGCADVKIHRDIFRFLPRLRRRPERFRIPRPSDGGEAGSDVLPSRKDDHEAHDVQLSPTGHRSDLLDARVLRQLRDDVFQHRTEVRSPSLPEESGQHRVPKGGLALRLRRLHIGEETRLDALPGLRRLQEFRVIDLVPE